MFRQSVAALSILAALSLGACSEQKKPVEAPKAPAAPVVAAEPSKADIEEITIYLSGPHTGQLATFGEQFRRGGEMAVKDINAKGGINGKKVKLVLGDDQCDPKQAVSVANKAVSEKATAVIGHFCSGSSIPASDVYAEANIVMISPSSTNPTLTDRNLKNVFRVCGRDDQQGVVAAEFINTKYKGKKVAILHDKSAYGEGLAKEVQKALAAGGGKEVLFEAITPGEKDYSTVVSKIKKAKADLVYLGGYHPEAGLIVKQLREQGSKAVLMGADALISKEFWQVAGDAGEGTIATFSPDPRKDAANAELIARYKAENFEPEGYTLYSYAAFEAYSQAAAKAGSVKTDDVIAALKGNTFKTVLGEISFDDKGDPKLPGYVIYQWSKGDYDYLK